MPAKVVYDYIDIVLSGEATPGNDTSTFYLEPTSRNTAIVYFAQQKYASAQQSFENIERRALFSDPHLVYFFGECLKQNREFQKANALYRHALQVSRDARYVYAEVLYLYGFGKLRYREKEFDHAMALFKSASKKAGMFRNFELKILSSEYIGHIYKRNTKYPEALIHYEVAEKYARLLKNPMVLMRCLQEKGHLLSLMQRNVQALKTYLECERIGVENPGYKIDLLSLKSRFYKEFHLLNLAKRNLKLANEIAQEHRLLKRQLHVQSLLGEMIYKEGRGEDARSAFHSYKQILTSKLAQSSVHNVIAQSYVFEKNYQAARRHFKRAIAMADSAQSDFYVASYLNESAANFIKLQDYSNALKNIASVLASPVLLKNPQIQAKASMLKGHIKRQQNDVVSAIKNYRKSVELYESIRNQTTVSDLRIGFFSEAHQASKFLAGCYLDKYIRSAHSSDLDSALYFISLGRNRDLKERIFGKKKNFNKDSTCHAIAEELQKKQRNWRHACTTYAPVALRDSLYEVVELEHFALMENRLYLFQSMDSVLSRNNVLNTQKIEGLHRRLLQQNQGCIIFHFVDEQIYAIVSNLESVRVILLPIKVPVLVEHVSHLVAPFTTVPSDSIHFIPFHANTAHQLYEELFLPIEKRMALPEDITIVADGVLNQLPFEMLLSKPAGKESYLPTDVPDYADKFLLHRYAIGYSPSVLPGEKKSKITGRHLLLLANPAHSINAPEKVSLRNGKIFSPLLYATAEARQIEKNADNATVLTGAQATHEKMKSLMGKNQVLHFATHAFSDSLFDAFSGVVLAPEPDSDDDGILMGYEIESMRFENYDLIFLSGCDTGKGRFVPGEGTLGLPRSFLGAGARSIIMTQWPIDDKFTSQLAPGFYKNYLRNQASKLRALSFAKRELLQNSSASHSGIYNQHPFYWAPFMLYGDPGENNQPFY
ncbi:MAG: CHAT domain-containing protein [Calditrichaeota bacterium]|nr:MAG: CHAT domain-containing protein [Calditrichota bacterium]